MAGRKVGAATEHVETGQDVSGLEPAANNSALFLDGNTIYAFSENLYSRWGKPLFGRVVGLLAPVILSPILLLIAAAIWVAVNSPVFLAEERVGRHGRVFRLRKFRTMDPDRRLQKLEWIGADQGLTHKSVHDPRITGLGRRLRATRLDELPQFVNVLMGDLALVGPRPEMVTTVTEYEPWQHRRHAIKPGITGPRQISDNGNALLRDCTEMELEYLDNVSWGTDLQIILRTLPAMIRRGGI